MSVFKIRINCTTQKDLTINNKKINTKSFSNCAFKCDNFITKIAILYEDNLHSKDDLCYITKTLEFFCDKEITQEEFINFINKLKDAGFISKRKEPKIQFISDNKVIYNYNYNLCLPFQKNSVKSIHKYQNLFII